MLKYIYVVPKVINDIQQSQHIDLDPTKLLSRENDTTLYQPHDHPSSHSIRGKSNKRQKQLCDHETIQRHVPRIGSDSIIEVSSFFIRNTLHILWILYCLITLIQICRDNLHLLLEI